LDKGDVASGGSGAAGAFLSPLLGKDNNFKSLVNKALIFSTIFYKNNFKDNFDNCGVLRIPKNNQDREKFISYQKYINFDYKNINIEKENGYFFDIGATIKFIPSCSNKIVLPDCILFLNLP
jgi:hypothetical protein